MKLPRNVLGSQLIKLLVKDYGWEIHRRSGSHVTLKKLTEPELLTVPDHGILKPGLLLAIIRKARIERDEIFQKL